MSEQLVGEAIIALRASQEKLAADMKAATGMILDEVKGIESTAGHIKLGIDITALHDGLELAQKAVEAVLEPLRELTVEVAHQGDEFGKLSERYGVAIDEMTGLKAVAKLADVDVTTLAFGLKTLSGNMLDAARGSKEATAKFAELGVSVTNADGSLKTSTQIIGELAPKFEEMTSGAERTARAVDLFGRSGAQMIPMLLHFNELAARSQEVLEGLGATWSEDTVRDATQLVDNIKLMGSAFEKLERQVGQELIPVFLDMSNAVLDLIKDNKELITSTIAEFFEHLRDAAHEARAGLDAVKIGVRDIDDAIAALLPNGSSLVSVLSDLVRFVPGFNEFKNAKAALDAFSHAEDLAAAQAVDLAREIRNTEEPTQAQLDQLSKLTSKYPAAARAVDHYNHSMNVLNDSALALAEDLGVFDEETERAATGAHDYGSNADEAAKAAKRAAEENKKLADSLKSLQFKGLADDVKTATEAVKESLAIWGSPEYLSALLAIQTELQANVGAANQAAEASIAAGADSGLAWQNAAAQIAVAAQGAQGELKSLDTAVAGNVTEITKWVQSLYDASPAIAQLFPQVQALGAALGVVGPKTNDAAKAIDRVDPTCQIASGAVTDFSRSLAGLVTGTESATQALTTFLGGALDKIPSIIDSLASSNGELFKGLGPVLGHALGSELAGSMASAGVTAAISLGASVFAKGASDVVKHETTKGLLEMGATFAPMTFGTSLIPGLIASIAGIGPTMQHKTAALISEWFKAALKDPQIESAIDDGLASVGSFLGPGLETLMIRAPKDMGKEVTEAWKALGTQSSYQFSDGFYLDMKQRGTELIHSSVADVLHVFYSDISNDVATGIQQSALAAGAAIAGAEGMLGDKAIKFAQQFAIAFVGMAKQAGLSADEILKALHRIDSSLGTSQELSASLDRLHGSMIDAGVDMNALYEQIDAQLKLITGHKVKIGNFEDVLEAVGGDGEKALGVIENGMDAAGISIARFAGNLSDVVLAISGDAGTAIKEAGQDFLAFGNDADGTADILRQKVLTALENVIATAEKLGTDSPEAIAAFRSAVALIPPEMFKSSAFVEQLGQDFAKMAVAGHTSVEALIDSFNPPLPNAIKQAILKTQDLEKELGKLSGAPLSSIKEVTDRMKQFAGDMYTTVKDETGKTTKVLTAFGEQTVNDLVSGLDGMWETITADGKIGMEEIAGVFQQIGMIPDEVFNDPAVQQSVHELLAKIGEQTGDATLIALSATTTITKEQLDAAQKQYDQWIKDHPAPEPPATVPDSGTTPTAGTDTGGKGTGDAPGEPAAPGAPAPAVPPPQPVPPETQKSYDDLTKAATLYAQAVVEGTKDTSQLSAVTREEAIKMLAAWTTLIGVPTDGKSVAALNELLGVDLAKTITDLTTLIWGETADWARAVDVARGAVINLHQELDALPTSKTITITEVTVSSGGNTTQPTPDHKAAGGVVGGQITGGPPEDVLTWLSRGELVVPAATATTLPPELVAQLLSGEAWAAPSSLFDQAVSQARVAEAPLVDRVSVVAGGSSASDSVAPGWRLVPIPEDALVDKTIVRIEKHSGNGWFAMTAPKEGGAVSVAVHPHLRARAGR